MFSNGLTIINGWNGLLAEVTAVVGGAHRNYGSMAWQRYFTTTTSIPVDSSPKDPALSGKDTKLNSGPKNVRSEVSPLDAGMSLVVSNCGLPKLSSEDWRKVLNSSLILAANNPPGAPLLVNDIMNQFCNHSSSLSVPARPVVPRSHLSWLNFRTYSSFAGRPRTAQWPSRDQVARASLSLRYLWTRSSRMYHLEEDANSDPDDARAQADYLKAIVDSDPEYVIRRVESSRYAVNSDVRQMYDRALTLVGPTSDRPSPGFKKNPMGVFATKEDQGEAGVGGYTSENPMHVVSHPAKRTLKGEAYELFRKGVILFLGVMLLLAILQSSLVNSVKSSTKPLQSKYSADTSAKKYTFEDVQGVEEAKEEIKEIVEFLRDPARFQKLGAKLPTGVLLIGPPGTGKTLLAKAVAGEADVPFLFVSGSEFDEMFVGVGAARVRKLFETAKSLKPCVLFIDELDAVGGKRFSSPVHPYSRMTLNQLLVELDGYMELEGVVVIGATNFPDALDSALTRPGRFDTSITLTLPDIKARLKILEVHSKKIMLHPSVELKKIARNTAGFSGADLASLVNQAALRGCVVNRECVYYEDLEYARERIMMGRERRSAVISEEEKTNTAYHEAGHAIVALYTPGSRPIHKATIIPRGPALGMVAYVNDDQLTVKKCQLQASIDTAVAGQVAEELIFGEENVTSGASNDFRVATQLATDMVTKYGMSKLGIFSHDLDKCGPARRKEVEEEIGRILQESHERVKGLLQTRADEHKRLAEGLLQYETLELDEIKLVIAGEPLDREI